MKSAYYLIWIISVIIISSSLETAAFVDTVEVMYDMPYLLHEESEENIIRIQREEKPDPPPIQPEEKPAHPNSGEHSKPPHIMKMEEFISENNMRLRESRKAGILPNWPFRDHPGFQEYQGREPDWLTPSLTTDLQSSERITRDIEDDSLENEIITPPDKSHSKPHRNPDDSSIHYKINTNDSNTVEAKGSNNSGMSLEEAEKYADYMQIEPINGKVPNTISVVDPSTFVSADPELLIFVDYKMCQRYNNNIKVITDYIAKFVNGINIRFNTMSNTRIRFQIAGINTLMPLASQIFLNKARVPDGSGWESVALTYTLGEWIYQNYDTLPKHDMALLLSGDDIQIYDRETKEYYKSVNGNTWLGGACQKNEQAKISLAVSVVEDKGEYSGIMHATHELAHNLGATHDGLQNAEDCSWDEGNIMSDKGGTKDKFYFSRCSIASMRSFIQNKEGDCLKHKVNKKVAVSVDNVGYAGRFTTMDAICKVFGSQKAIVDANIDPGKLCSEIICFTKGRSWITGIPAPDDTPCGDRGRCWEGSCLSPINRLFLRTKPMNNR